MRKSLSLGLAAAIGVAGLSYAQTGTGRPAVPLAGNTIIAARQAG